MLGLENCTDFVFPMCRGRQSTPFLGLVHVAIFAASLCASAKVMSEDVAENTPSTYEVLEKLRQDLLQAFATFPNENDTKSRQLLIQAAKKTFDADVKGSEKSKDSIRDQFSRYLSNLSLARTGFRSVIDKYKDGTQVKQAFVAATAKAFWEDIVHASDYSQKEDLCAWFKECVDMFKKAQLLEAGDGDSRDASQAYSNIQKLFSAVLKEGENAKDQNAVENMKTNMIYLRGQYPTNTEELKKKNGRIAKFLESMAQQQFKHESAQK